MQNESFYTQQSPFDLANTFISHMKAHAFDLALAPLNALQVLISDDYATIAPHDKQKLRTAHVLVTELLAQYRHMPLPSDDEDEWDDETQHTYRTRLMHRLNGTLTRLLHLGIQLEGTPGSVALSNLDAWPHTESKDDRSQLMDALLTAGAYLDVQVTSFLKPEEPAVNVLAYVLMGGFDYEDKAQGLEVLLAHGATLPDYDAFITKQCQRGGFDFTHPWAKADQQHCLEAFLKEMPITGERVFRIFDLKGNDAFNLNEPFWALTSLPQWIEKGWVPGNLTDPDTGRSLFHAWAAASPAGIGTEDLGKVEHLLRKHGADPMAVDHQRNTPLHQLMWNGDVDRERLTMLTDWGLSLDDTNAEGNTCRDLAAFNLDYATQPETKNVLAQIVADGRQDALNKVKSKIDPSRRRPRA